MAAHEDPSAVEQLTVGVLAQGGPRFKIEVKQEGMADLSGLFGESFDMVKSMAKACWEGWFLECNPHSGGKAQLFDLLCDSAYIDAAHGLHAQLLWWVTRHIENSMWKSKNGPFLSMHALHSNTVDLLSLLWKPRALDFQLLKHVIAGREASRGQLRHSWVVDEANVGGLSLHSGFIALPNNTGFVAAPQGANGVVVQG